MFNILREVNRVRKVAGFEQIPSSAIWLKRRIVRPFDATVTSEGSDAECYCLDTDFLAVLT